MSAVPGNRLNAAVIASRRGRAAWSDDKIATARAMAERGESARAIARVLGCNSTTVQRHCTYHRIDLDVEKRRLEAGAEVLRRMYATATPMPEIRAAYNAARGRVGNRTTMEDHARRLKLYRPPEVIQEQRMSAAAKGRESIARTTGGFWTEERDELLREKRKAGMTYTAIAAEWGVTKQTVLGRADRIGLLGTPANRRARQSHKATGAREKARAERMALAARMQARLDQGWSLARTCMEMGVGEKKARKMRSEGLLTIKARSNAAPMAYAPVVPMGPCQTVEEWLAAGGTIKKCPPAFAGYTAGVKLPEEARAELREHAKDQYEWIKKHGGNAWRAERAAYFQRSSA